MKRTGVFLVLGVLAAVAVAWLVAALSAPREARAVAVTTPVVQPQKQQDSGASNDVQAYKNKLAESDKRFAALVEINTSLVTRVEKLEGRIKKWEEAQRATYALQEEIRLRLETLSRGFVRYDPEHPSNWLLAPNTSNAQPTLNDGPNVTDPDLPTP